jgi:DNA adenine methylase
MKPQPFVRWLGGKRRLAGRVLDLLGQPEPGGRFFEPFLGGGAVFFALRAARYDGPALLSDVNTDLVVLYRVVRDQLDDLLEALAGWPRDKAVYYALRAVDPEYLGDVDRAARAYYLNRCAVNGIWRVNQKGRYNVPYAKLKGPLVDEARLRAASTALQGAVIGPANVIGDINPFVEWNAGEGDRVFLDPPYLGTFTGYSSGGWTVEDSQRLERRAQACVDRGARVVATLPDCEEECETWKHWKLLETSEARSVAADGKRRGKVPCMMAVDLETWDWYTQKPDQCRMWLSLGTEAKPDRNERLAAAIEQAGTNQTQLAAAVGVTQSQVNRWVAGTLNPTYEQLKLAIRALVPDLAARESMGTAAFGYRVEHRPIVRRLED